jgi:hypothetical protein
VVNGLIGLYLQVQGSEKWDERVRARLESV